MSKRNHGFRRVLRSLRLNAESGVDLTSEAQEVFTQTGLSPRALLAANESLAKDNRALQLVVQDNTVALELHNDNVDKVLQIIRHSAGAWHQAIMEEWHRHPCFDTAVIEERAGALAASASAKERGGNCQGLLDGSIHQPTKDSQT